MAFIDTATGEAVIYPDLGDSHYDLAGFGDNLYWCTMPKGLIKLEEYDYNIWDLDFPEEFEMRTVIPNSTETIVAVHGVLGDLFFYDMEEKRLFQKSRKQCRKIFYDKYINAFVLEIRSGVFEVYDGERLLICFVQWMLKIKHHTWIF